MARDGRMPAAIGCVAGFGAYLVLSAGITMFAPGGSVDVGVLVVVAVVIGFWTALPGAALVGLLGWLFYSGFVTHSKGVLGVTGVRDAVIAIVLVTVAVLASLLHGSITRERPPVGPVKIPAQRRPMEHLQHR